MRVVRGAARALRARDRAAHAPFTPVVGGERQLPVPEHPVEVLEVVERRAGALEHVLTIVAPKVLVQGIVVPGRRHELPTSPRPRFGKRLRLEGALDERQERQLHGHAARLDVLDDVVEILTRAVCHAAQVRGIPRIKAQPPVHRGARQIRNREPAPDALPHVSRDRILFRRRGRHRHLLGGSGAGGVPREADGPEACSEKGAQGSLCHGGGSPGGWRRIVVPQCYVPRRGGIVGRMPPTGKPRRNSETKC